MRIIRFNTLTKLISVLVLNYNVKLQLFKLVLVV